MKRRKFIHDLGLGSSSVLLTSSVSNDKEISDYSYGRINALEEAVTKDGLINIRLEFKSREKSTISNGCGKIDISNGVINRIKEYFFEPREDIIDGLEYEISSSNEKVDIISIWIEKAKPVTKIRIKDKSENVFFTLKQLVEKQEILLEFQGQLITANFLLDREMAEIEPEDFNAKNPGENFKLVVMADPQGGDPAIKGNHPTRMKIHNAWIEESIKQTNLMNPFATLILGDIVDSQGQERNFKQMAAFFKKVESPILYAVGNHETTYNSVFTPGYNMEAFNNFFSAQKELNGLELMLYSFNLGKWHFIVWPDPLRANFWETHPHYFDWLERDLEKYKATPTIFFQHVPSHPIGIDPLINYAESVDVKRTLLKILSKHRNVKYIFSGHVHIPIKASFKTAITYKGIKMINLPPAGYRPRAFGEEDYHGGPCQGILILNFNNKDCTVTYRTVIEEEYHYPDKLPDFEAEKYKLWLNHKWELPVSDEIDNDISSWIPRFVYHEDANPSTICKTKEIDNRNGLFLYSRKRGFDMPGQDRLPQTINRICQVASLKKHGFPVLNFSYKIDKDSDVEGWCGAFVWLEGFAGSNKLLNLVYSSGIAYAGLGGKFNRSEFTENIHLGLSGIPNKWHKVTLIPAKDHEDNQESSYAELNLDRLAINLGVWTINDGSDYPYGIYFSHLELGYSNSNQLSSKVNGNNIESKPENKIWWLGKYFPFDHIAGDHRYILGTKKMIPKG